MLLLFFFFFFFGNENTEIALGQQFVNSHTHLKHIICHLAAVGNCKLHKCKHKTRWKPISQSYLKSKGCIIFASVDYHCGAAFCCTRNSRLISEWHACNMAATKRRTEACMHKPSVYLVGVCVCVCMRVDSDKRRRRH